MKKRILGTMAIAITLASISVAYARYSVITHLSINGDIFPTYANVYSSANFREYVDATLTVYIEESSNNGVSYHDYGILDSVSGYGRNLEISKTVNGLNKNCKYRMKAEVVVEGGETEVEYLY